MNLFNVLQNVFFPLMSAHQDDETRLLKIYKKGIQGTAFIIIPAMVGLMLIADPFVHAVLSDKWNGAIIVIQWIALSRIIIPISALNCSIINAVGRSDIYLKVDLLKLPLTIGALLVTFSFGLEVIVIGNVIVSAICFFINAYYPGKWFGFGAWEQLKKISPIIFCTLCMALPLYFIEMDNKLLEMIVKLGIGPVIYSAMCYLMKVDTFMEICALFKNKIKKESA